MANWMCDAWHHSAFCFRTILAKLQTAAQFCKGDLVELSRRLDNTESASTTKEEQSVAAITEEKGQKIFCPQQRNLF